jgi:hypothetical protein
VDVQRLRDQRLSAAALDQRMEQATPFDVNSHHNEGFDDNPAAP